MDMDTARAFAPGDKLICPRQFVSVVRTSSARGSTQELVEHELRTNASMALSFFGPGKSAFIECHHRPARGTPPCGAIVLVHRLPNTWIYAREVTAKQRRHILEELDAADEIFAYLNAGESTVQGHVARGQPETSHD